MSETVSASLQRALRKSDMPSLIPVDDDIRLERALPSQAKLYADTIANNVEHLSRWESWPRITTPRLMEQRLRISPNTREAHYGIFDVTSLRGFVNMHSRDGRVAELGYWLTEEAVGKGVATRAARTLADMCFRHLDIEKLRLNILL